MTSSDLATYQLQLQQVEAALTSDPENPELLKLKEDLSQVIQLTQELIQSQVDKQDTPDAPPTDDSAPAPPSVTPVKHWQVGERCQALWDKDGNYYECVIDEITTDGHVSVTFRHNRQQGVTSLGTETVKCL